MKTQNKVTVRNFPGLKIEALGNKPVVRTMKEIQSILAMLDIPFWFSAGSALGIAREEDLYIKYDTDIDLEIMGSDEVIQSISKVVATYGYKIVRVMKDDKDRLMQVAYITTDDILVDFYLYYDEGGDEVINYNEHGTLTIPKKFLKPTGICNNFIVPNPIEEYLVYRYGKDWKIPTGAKGSWSAQAGEALK